MNDNIKKYNSIDLFKFIMAILVVAIYTDPLINCNIVWVNNLYDSLVRCAVPFFFIASGYLIGKKMKYPFDSEENKKILNKYLIKIIKMYLIWSAIYLPLAIIDYVRHGYSFLYSLALYFRGLFFVGEHYNSWMLWYLLSLIFGIVLIKILQKFHFNIEKIILVGILFFLLSLGIDYLVAYEETLPSLLELLKKIITYTISKGRVFYSMLYIPIGIFLANRETKISHSIIFLIIGFLGNIFAGKIINNIFVILCVTGLFILITKIELKNHKIYKYLRNFSTIIYLIHMYIWTFYYMIVYKTKTYGVDSFIITAIVCIIISYIYVFILDKIKKKRDLNHEKNNI